MSDRFLDRAEHQLLLNKIDARPRAMLSQRGRNVAKRASQMIREVIKTLRRNAKMVDTPTVPLPIRRAIACGIQDTKVRNLMGALGVSELGQDQNVCESLGHVFDAKLIRPKRSSGAARRRTGTDRVGVPVKILGTGIAGLAMKLSNGDAIKISSLSKKTGPISWSAEPVQSSEFAYEVLMTQKAGSLLTRDPVVRIPPVKNVHFLRAKKGGVIGIVRLGFAPGIRMIDAIANAFRRGGPRNQRARELVSLYARTIANIHKKDLVHGDIHASNLILDKKRVWVLDWARSAEKSFFLQDRYPSGHTVWKSLKTFDVAMGCRDLRRNGMGALIPFFLHSYGKWSENEASDIYEIDKMVTHTDAIYRRYIHVMFRVNSVMTSTIGVEHRTVMQVPATTHRRRLRRHTG